KRLKTRRELEAERAELIAQQDRSPRACQAVELILKYWEELTRQAQPATPERRRWVYERVNLRARLEVVDGVKLAHVTCTAGEETLTVDRIAAGVSRILKWSLQKST